jgi:hypothetical protein
VPDPATKVDEELILAAARAPATRLRNTILVAAALLLFAVAWGAATGRWQVAAAAAAAQGIAILLAFLARRMMLPSSPAMRALLADPHQVRAIVRRRGMIEVAAPGGRTFLRPPARDVDAFERMLVARCPAAARAPRG